MNSLLDFILMTNMSKLKKLKLAFYIDHYQEEVLLSIFLSNLKKKISKIEFLENFSIIIKGCYSKFGPFILEIAELISFVNSLKILKIEIG